MAKRREQELREQGLSNSALIEALDEMTAEMDRVKAQIQHLAAGRHPIGWRELEGLQEALNKLQERSEQHNFYHGHDDPELQGNQHTPDYDKKLTKRARDKWTASKSA